MKCEKTITTGFQSLDRVLFGGFHSGSLNVIAARTGVGKTIFSLQCAAGMAKNSGKEICFFSMLTAPDYVMWKLADLCRQGNVIHDDTAIKLSQIRTRLAGISDLGAVIIDSFEQILPEDGAHAQNVADANEIARELKMISRELDVPVICTCYLPRSQEKRLNCRPVLRDFDRISGGLVQDSDVILSLYRPVYYDTEEIEDPTEAEVIVVKNCYGECDILPFRFGKIPQFSEDM